jgi:hypothetical protein
MVAASRLVSAIHFYWAAGGTRWLDRVIPRTTAGTALFHPGRIACLLVALLLLLASIATLTTFDSWLKTQMFRAMSLLFALRAIGDFRYAGFTKRIRHTPFAFWDTRLYSPLCIFMALLALLCATSTHPR